MNEHEKDRCLGAYKVLKTDKHRVEMKLRIIKRGDRSCLSCDRKFFSEDLASERMCETCRSHEEWIR